MTIPTDNNELAALVEKFTADCRLAAETLTATNTFETGQIILKDAADIIEALAAEVLRLRAVMRSRTFTVDHERETALRAERTVSVAEAARVLLDNPEAEARFVIAVMERECLVPFGDKIGVRDMERIRALAALADLPKGGA